MAGFKKQPTEQKPTVKKADGQSIEELKKELNEVSLEIKSLLGGTKDKNSLDFDTRGKLGNKYVHAATLAKEIAERTTNEKEQEEFFNYYKKWSKTAEGYGSAIQFDTSTTTLDDVKGLEEVKDLVRSFIFLAKNPTILEKYKIEGGFGLFMYGAPGTGKTMFAKAIAHELNLPLFVVEPSDIFKSYVGESEASVKRLFEQIEYCKTGAVVFVDECDELFSRRSSGSKDYKSAVTNQLLQNLNGFSTDGSKRILIAATNLPWNVDPAYLRYKRFSHHVHITPPDESAIKAILKSKLAGVPTTSDVNIDDIYTMLASQCKPSTSLSNNSSLGVSYYSSADICGIIEEACRMAVEQIISENTGRGKKIEVVNEYPPVTLDMFEKAILNKKPSISAESYESYKNFRVGQKDGVL